MYHFSVSNKNTGARKIISVIVIILCIISIIIMNRNNEVIHKNNTGLREFDSGNQDKAIKNMEFAREKAYTDETKMNTALNLAYIHSRSSPEKSLFYLKDALTFAEENSPEYFLIKGEIDLLEKNPDGAEYNFNQAHNLRSNDFQINNTLNLFYQDAGNYQKAIEHGENAYKARTEGTKNIAKQNLGIAYALNGNYDKAIEFLKGFDLDTFPNISLWIGLAYAGKGDIKNAKISFQKATDSGQKLPQEVKDFLSNNP